MSQEEMPSVEKSMLSVHSFIRSVFEKHFGKEAIIGVKLTPLSHECWITVLVSQRTQEMIGVADELQRDFLEEWGKHICIFVKRPWRAAIRNLAAKILPWGVSSR